jgi:hypothetical protein
MLLTPADKGLAGGEMEQLSSLIRRALDDMRVYQGRLLRDPAVAQVSLAGAPHALVPTRVVAQAFPEALQDLVGADCAPLVMYRLGHLIGQTQAAAFFAERAIDPTDLPYRVLTGPFHIAWAGYADVDLLVWEPHADGRFAVLWESDNSCCAREVARERRRTRACHLPAGYSAGWCTEAAGLSLPVAWKASATAGSWSGTPRTCTSACSTHASTSRPTATRSHPPAPSPRCRPDLIPVAPRKSAMLCSVEASGPCCSSEASKNSSASL